MARLKRSRYISRDTVYIKIINVYQKYTVSLIELIGSLSDRKPIVVFVILNKLTCNQYDVNLYLFYSYILYSKKYN